MDKNFHSQWQSYKESELKILLPILTELGYTISDNQTHTQGERFLMSGYKLVLIGASTKNQERVIIKFSSKPSGSQEIIHEHHVVQTLKDIHFMSQAFLIPKSILFKNTKKYTLLINSFIEEEKGFLEHDFEKQFFLALSAFETQEGLHITARTHKNKLKNIFTFTNSDTYIAHFLEYKKYINNKYPDKKVSEILDKTLQFIKINKNTLERYCDFSTHNDFVPHNMLIHNNNIFFLDPTSISVGNKYESWARFQNYMLLYNRPLEMALSEYVQNNRPEDEYLANTLMRLYKLGELLQYHAKAYSQSSDDLKKLCVARMEFWSDVMDSLLKGESISADKIEVYKKLRDSLRSTEEIKRQKTMKQL